MFSKNVCGIYLTRLLNVTYLDIAHKLLMRLNESAAEAPDTVQRLLHASRVGDATTARLAAWLLEERKQIVDLPISRFAQETGVTETTIVRFCKAIGYSGYRELRLALVQSVGIAKGLQLGAAERQIPEV